MRCAFSAPPPSPYNGIPPNIQLEDPPRQACRTPYRTPLGPHTKEWNGGLAEEHVRRENAIHTQTRGVRVSQSKRENHPVPQEGGWEIEWPYIHKDMVGVCVCVYGKRENHPVPQGGGGRVLLPPWPARTVGKPQNRRGGGGRGEYTMTSNTYCSTRVHDRIPWGGKGGKEWNGGLAGEHVRRENAIHTQTRGVCVCMCLRAKGKTIVFHRRGVGG